jgi:hypothetical protein
MRRISRGCSLLAGAAIFALGMAAALPPVAAAEELPRPKDDRDVLHDAAAFHIQLRTQAEAQALHDKLVALPESQRFEAFKRAARSQSVDAGSRASGGDLGAFGEGTFDRAFEAGVFAQAPKEVSAPIQSEFGWHLVWLTRLTQTPVSEICDSTLAVTRQSAPADQRPVLDLSAARFAEPGMFELPITRLLGEGWSAPMNWRGELSYFRLLPADAAQPGMPRVILHVEHLHALYSQAPRGCIRSARYSLQVDCRQKQVAIDGHTGHEGRAASGRLLTELRYKPEFAVAKPGTLNAQLVELACAPGRTGGP